jgi:hypothetical protein
MFLISYGTIYKSLKLNLKIENVQNHLENIITYVF